MTVKNPRKAMVKRKSRPEITLSKARTGVLDRYLADEQGAYKHFTSFDFA